MQIILWIMIRQQCGAISYLDTYRISLTTPGFMAQESIMVRFQRKVIGEVVDTQSSFEEKPTGLADLLGSSTAVLILLCQPHTAFLLGRSMVHIKASSITTNSPLSSRGITIILRHEDSRLFARPGFRSRRRPGLRPAQSSLGQSLHRQHPTHQLTGRTSEPKQDEATHADEGAKAMLRHHRQTTRSDTIWLCGVSPSEACSCTAL